MHRAGPPPSGHPTDFRRSDCHSGGHQPRALQLGANATLWCDVGRRKQVPNCHFRKERETSASRLLVGVTAFEANVPSRSVVDDDPHRHAARRADGRTIVRVVRVRVVRIVHLPDPTRRLSAQLVGDAGEDHARLEEEQPFDVERPLVVQQPAPAGDDQLGHDHRHDGLPVGCELAQVGAQRVAEVAERRLDDLERHADLL